MKISPIASPDLRQGGIHSNLFKQREAFPSDLYFNLFQAGRGSGWGWGEPWHRGQSWAPGRPPQHPCASRSGSWYSPWFLGWGLQRGGWAPARGTGRETRQPSQQALLGWRAQLWIRFSRNTKQPAWSLSPRHWGLCQACAHPLCPCQGGGWAGRTDPVAPAGLSGGGGGGHSYSPEALPSRPPGNRTAQAGRGASTLESSLAGWRAPRCGGALSTSAWCSDHVSFLD